MRPVPGVVYPGVYPGVYRGSTQGGASLGVALPGNQPSPLEAIQSLVLGRCAALPGTPPWVHLEGSHGGPTWYTTLGTPRRGRTAALPWYTTPGTPERAAMRPILVHHPRYTRKGSHSGPYTKGWVVPAVRAWECHSQASGTTARAERSCVLLAAPARRTG